MKGAPRKRSGVVIDNIRENKCGRRKSGISKGGGEALKGGRLTGGRYLVGT